jgi:hypothetical protein
MCDDCVRRAAQIDPRLVKLMEDIKPHYQAMQALLADSMKDIVEMDIIDENGEEPTDVGPDHEAEIKRAMLQIAGILGVGYAVGWNTAIDSDDPQDLNQKIDPLMSQMRRGFEDGISYGYVVHQRKH